MSSTFADRTAALLHLRHAQARVVSAIVPDIANEPGASATPSMLRLDGVNGGRFIVQRVRVERIADRFGLDASFNAAEAEWNPDGTSVRQFVQKADGTLRLDLTTSADEFHSITLLHGGRVLQLTSYSPEIGGTPAPTDDAHAARPEHPVSPDARETGHAMGDHETSAADGAAADAAAGAVHGGTVLDDPLSADTLTAPPEFTEAERRAALAEDDAAGDPRPRSLTAEEHELGPDYGHRLRHTV